MQTNTRLRIARYVVLAIPFVSCAIPVLGHAQSAPANQSALAEIKSLTDRVALLEQKLAKLDQRLITYEASRANNLQTPTSSTNANAPNGPQAPGALSKSDESRLANLETQVNNLESQQKNQNEQGDTQTVAHPHAKTGPTRVTAPFEVVEPGGAVIMSVQSNRGGSIGGIQLTAPDGSSIQIGSGTGSGSALRVYSGPVSGEPRLFVGLEGDDGVPSIALGRAVGDGTVAHLFENDGAGRLILSNSNGEPSAFLGTNHDDGELQLSSSVGKLFADIESSGGRGELSLFNSAGQAVVLLGSSKKENGELDLLNSSGTNFASLASSGGNGELDLFNPAGQNVALIGSNPVNGEGHAAFTNAGGTPLAKIGAAGPHGDVLLGGPDKALAVWEMMLTGFH